ncbi:DUF4271 domain-containing protein [Puia dinghuensis]|uniref:DUF4271 domain-containing protein n=1 Tax=Puia dinghuensis TaxID=1792502 RepID=A0A8J2XUJ5_9BACT|nr:DUF4271 domain-containing protein [Puia dinghuensis]GGB07862.1 hypothetical protein GCM10011511_34270 [Puia dinghuensis]
MIRLCSLLLFCLLMLTRADAQTDTTRPPAGQPDSARHLSPADSLRRDSLARVRKARRDSLRLVRLAAKRDSIAVAQKDSVSNAAATKAAIAAAQKDSLAKAVTPTATATPAAVKPSAPPPPAPVVREGPPELSFWQKVLTRNPFFNFTGMPVVDIYELHHSNSKDSLFYLLVGILFYFALIRISFEKYFNNLMTLFFRVSLRQQQIREQVLQTPLPSLLLNILFIISGGLYACYLVRYSRIGEGIGFWMLYLYCMAALATIYLVKFVVLKFVGWVFSISRATDIYIFVVFLVNKMLGIFLLPFLILITFSGPEVREIFITISLAMVFVMWAYRALAGYRPVRSEIKLAPFYFFLYLCAFEVAPLLLIYKVLLTYLEKVY